MAHMAEIETIKKVRSEYDDLAVVCYINSTAALKEYSDVCVTSANAVKIVKELPQKNIFFIPDRNLAHYVASQVPEKNFVYNNGFCPTHERIEAEDVANVKGTASRCTDCCPWRMSGVYSFKWQIMLEVLPVLLIMLQRVTVRNLSYVQKKVLVIS